MSRTLLRVHELQHRWRTVGAISVHMSTVRRLEAELLDATPGTQESFMQGIGATRGGGHLGYVGLNYGKVLLTL